MTIMVLDRVCEAVNYENLAVTDEIMSCGCDMLIGIIAPSSELDWVPY